MGAEPTLEEQAQSESGGRRLGGKEYTLKKIKYTLWNITCTICINIQVGEAVEAQYVSVEDEDQTEATVAALHNSGNSENAKPSSSL